MSEIDKDILIDDELLNEDQEPAILDEEDDELLMSRGEASEDDEDLQDDEADEEDADNEDPSAEPTEDEELKEEEDPATNEGEKNFKMKRLLRNMLRDDDSEGASLKDMFNDIQISREWLRHHWSFLLIVFVCMLAFVSNRYEAQQEIIEEAKLKQELNDWKYIWLTQFSELTRSSRQSHIESTLRQRGDTTLRLSKEAPFLIKVK